MACLGTRKIVVSPGGRATTDKTHLWRLNGGDGLVLRGDAAGRRFLASMHYRIIPTDPEKYDVEQGRWRVTTSAYLNEYRTPDNAKRWAMHWHPAGKSHATFPHLHLYTVRSDGFSSRRDRPSSRRGAVVHRDGGAEPQNSQWRTVLAESEGIHSSTGRGRRTRHRRQLVGDAGPHLADPERGWSAEGPPRFP